MRKRWKVVVAVGAYSSPRAFLPLRLLMFAGVLTLGWVIAGAISASAAENSAPIVPVYSQGLAVAAPVSVKIPTVPDPATMLVKPALTSTPVAEPVKAVLASTARVAEPVKAVLASTTPVARLVKPVLTVSAPIAALVKPVPTVTLPIATLVKPFAALVKPVSALIEPLTPTGGHAANQFSLVVTLVANVGTRVHAVVAAPPTGSRANVRAPAGSAVVSGPTIVSPSADASLSAVEAALPSGAGSVGYQTISAASQRLTAPPEPSPLAPGQPNPLGAPFGAPASITTSASNTDSGGRGSGLAHVGDGPHTAAALRLGSLPDSPWDLNESRANDPGSLPD